MYRVMERGKRRNFARLKPKAPAKPKRCLLLRRLLANKYLRISLPHIGLVALSALYTLLGAVIFWHLEKPFEIQKRNATLNRLSLIRIELIAELWNASQSGLVSEADWSQQAEQAIYNVSSALWGPYTKDYMRPEELEPGLDPSQLPVRWTFVASIFFSWTAITTIGYGHIVPRTFKGRIVCLVYTLMGIPLILVTIADMGRFLSGGIIWLHQQTSNFTNWFCGNICRCCGAICCFVCRRRAAKMTDSEKERAEKIRKLIAQAEKEKRRKKKGKGRGKTPLDSPEKADTFEDISEIHSRSQQSPGKSVSGDTLPEEFNQEDFMREEAESRRVSVLFILVILVGYTSLGAALIRLWEEWDFFDAFYYCFVTVTTIGFGDIVPQQEAYFWATLAYIILGLIITTMCIDLVGSEYIRDIHFYGRNMGRLAQQALMTFGGKVVHLGEVSPIGYIILGLIITTMCIDLVGSEYIRDIHFYGRNMGRLAQQALMTFGGKVVHLGEVSPIGYIILGLIITTMCIDLVGSEYIRDIHFYGRNMGRLAQQALMTFGGKVVHLGEVSPIGYIILGPIITTMCIDLVGSEYIRDIHFYGRNMGRLAQQALMTFGGKVVHLGEVSPIGYIILGLIITTMCIDLVRSEYIRDIHFYGRNMGRLAQQALMTFGGKVVHLGEVSPIGYIILGLIITTMCIDLVGSEYIRDIHFYGRNMGRLAQQALMTFGGKVVHLGEVSPIGYIILGLIITTMCIDLVGSEYIRDIHFYGRNMGRLAQQALMTFGGKVVHLGEVFGYVAFLQKNYGLTPEQLDKLANLPDNYLLDCLIHGRQPNVNWGKNRPFIPHDIYYFKWIEHPRTHSYASERLFASMESIDVTSRCSTVRTPREYYQHIMMQYALQDAAENQPLNAKF